MRFLGVTTLLFTDGQTSFMTDGFFTRPGGFLCLALGRKIAPDVNIITGCIKRAGIDRLVAVMPLHSHYDHAMDAPEVALQTGATLLGSESTANIGRGWGLPEKQIEVVIPGETYRFGDFKLTFIRSVHVPLRVNVSRRGTEITDPLVPPVAALDYKVGEVYSLHIEHPLGRMLIHGSAGFVPGALQDISADIVFLSIGGLGHLDHQYKEAYFNEVVEAVGATRIVPLHYDDFTIPLDQPLRSLPRLLDDVEVAFDFLIEKTKEHPNLEMEMCPVWDEVVIFSLVL